MGSVRTCNLELDDSDNLKNAQYPNYVDKFFSSLSAGLLMSFGVTGSTSMQSKVYWLHCSEARLKVWLRNKEQWSVSWYSLINKTINVWEIIEKVQI